LLVIEGSLAFEPKGSIKLIILSSPNYAKLALLDINIH